MVPWDSSPRNHHETAEADVGGVFEGEATVEYKLQLKSQMAHAAKPARTFQAPKPAPLGATMVPHVV